MNNSRSMFKEWLSQIFGVKNFMLREGHWSTFEKSVGNRYISYYLDGGSQVPGLLARMPVVQVVIVGSIEDGQNWKLDDMFNLANRIIMKTADIPNVCGLVSVSSLGEPSGPMLSSSGRPLLNLTLEMIY